MFIIYYSLKTLFPSISIRVTWTNAVSGWIWRCVSDNGIWKNPWMFLCYIWRVSDSSANSNNRQQLQQVLRPPEEVGETREFGGSEEIPKLIHAPQDQHRRDSVHTRTVDCRCWGGGEAVTREGRCRILIWTHDLNSVMWFYTYLRRRHGSGRLTPDSGGMHGAIA